jgi:shikimate kinase
MDEISLRLSRQQSLIFLVGFMGAGKTTVGKYLAERLGVSFIDLDDLIEAKAGKPVRDIFSTTGETAFRELERQAVESLATITSTVVALGGGAYVMEANRAKLRELGITVWLDCSAELCWLRISGDPGRPLLGALSDMEKLLELRRPEYEQADVHIRVSEESPILVADYIVEELAKHSS